MYRKAATSSGAKSNPATRGEVTLADLFGARSQLLVYLNGIDVHLAHRDVSMVAISRAPLAKIEVFRTRMGWAFTWVSSFASDFNYDYGVSFTPDALRGDGAPFNYTKRERRLTDHAGVSVFARNANGIFHPRLLDLLARPRHAERRL